MKKWIVIIASICLVIGLQAQNTNPFQLYSTDTMSLNITSVDTSEKLDTISKDSSKKVESTEVDTDPIITEPNSSLEPELEKPTTSKNPFNLVDEESMDLALEVKEDSIVYDSLINENYNSDTSTVFIEKAVENLKELVEIPKVSNTFVFWLSLICGLLLSIVFTIKRNILGEVNKSLRNMNFMKLFQKDMKNGFTLPFILLQFIYVINLSIFIRFLSIYFEIPLFSYRLILIFIVVAFLLILKHLSLFGISYLRNKLVDALNYSFILTLVNSWLGLILIPFNLLLAFGPEILFSKVVIIGIIILVIMWLLKWVRGFINSIRIVIGDSFHFLLYLCACEIVPILICIGFVRNLIN